MRTKNIIMSNFYCVKCGQKNMPIWRRKGNEREAGHLKKIYCIHCKCETNNVECKPLTKYSYEQFLEEFYGGNFSEDGLRKEPYGIFKDNLVKENKWDDLKKTISHFLGKKEF